MRNRKADYIPTERLSNIEHHQTSPYDMSVHSVELIRDTPLHQLLKEETCLVNSYHHQAVRELAPDLEAMAFSEDGLMEAVYVPEKNLSGRYSGIRNFHLEQIRIVEKYSRLLLMR